MATKQIGFGVIGLGMGASRSQMIHETKGAKLVAVSDLREDRAKPVAEKFGVPWHTDYHRLLEDDDIQVIVVMTESGKHADLGIEAAKAGKHVIVTKPMDVKVAKADALIQTCRKAKVKLLVDFQMRYEPGPLYLWQAMQKGRLGKPILGQMTMKWFRTQEYYHANGGWRGTWRWDGGGSLANQGIHFIDMLRWFMGPVQEVQGKIGIFNHQIETEDLGMAMLKFESGAAGNILTTTTYPGEREFDRIEIHGDRGAAVLEGSNITLWQPADKKPLPQLKPTRPRNCVEDMIDAIRKDREPFINGLEGRKSLELLEAIYQSARRDGGKIQLRRKAK